MNYENKELVNQINAMEKDLHHAHLAIQQYEEKQDQMMYDIQQYDQNVTVLTQQLEDLHQQFEETRMEKDSLIKDHETQRNISFNLESSKEELQRHIIQLEKERMMLYNQLDNFKRELDMYKQRADYERSRYHQLETILTNERMKMQQYEQECDSLIKEKEMYSNSKLQESYSNRYSNYDEDDDGTYSIASSNKSYDNRNKANLQKVISQLESEIEQEELAKTKKQ